MCVCILVCIQEERAVEESQQQVHSEVNLDPAISEEAVPEEYHRAGAIAIMVVAG